VSCAIFPQKGDKIELFHATQGMGQGQGHLSTLTAAEQKDLRRMLEKHKVPKTP
jgi:hypothetical protein